MKKIFLRICNKNIKKPTITRDNVIRFYIKISIFLAFSIHVTLDTARNFLDLLSLLTLMIKSYKYSEKLYKFIKFPTISTFCLIYIDVLYSL